MTGPREDARPTFEEIVDACLGDIAAGRRSVEECLARHIELRSELEPLLRAAAAMRRLPRFEQRAPDPARRASLLADLATTPQRGRRWLRRPHLAFPRFAAVARGLAYAAPVALIAVLAIVLLNGRETGTAQASSLAVFSGGVERRVDGAWRPLEGNTVEEGDRLRTTADGRALITFEDGSTVALEPSTEVVLSRVRSDATATIEIEQFAGALWNDVATASDGAHSYRVRTPDAIVIASGTVFGTDVRPGETEVVAAEGSVDVESDGERVTLAARQSLIARGANAATHLDQRGPAAASTLTVDAPFAASVVSAHGQATGVQREGDLHQYLPGATTTMPAVDGPQQLRFLAGFPDGEYTLILRRFADGDGALVITDAHGVTRRIPLGGEVSTELRLVVEVTHEAGVATVEVLSAAARPAPADVIETLPTPLPTRTATDRPATPAPAPTVDLASVREQYLLATRTAYLERLADALREGDPHAVAQALRAATEGDAAVVLMRTLGEQLKNRTVQLRLIQVLGTRATLPLSLWLDTGGSTEELRIAVLSTLARYTEETGDTGDAAGSDTAPADRPSTDAR